MTLRDELQQAVAMLFNRRLGTMWSDKELKAFNRLITLGCLNDLEQIRVVSRYYGFERRKGQKGIYRRDLYTFLNNFNGELDRAMAWAETNPINRNHSKNFGQIQPKSEQSDEEWQRISAQAKVEFERFKELYR
jgi:hypothetical protein